MFRVVIVEDEPPIIRSMKEKIARADPDFKVVGEYYNGEAALLELDIFKPHVLITDLEMPVMDGTVLLDKVRTLYPDIICVILSGYQKYEYTRMAVRKGITDYLLKPPTEENIGELLATLKLQLLQNQSLIETEILQQLFFPNRQQADFRLNAAKFAKEYYYHAHYVALYAWIPPELRQECPSEPLIEAIGGWLAAGERQYSVSSLAHERLLLVGAHDVPDSRLAALERKLLSLSGMANVSFAVLHAAGGVDRIPALLPKLYKAAGGVNRPAAVAFVHVRADEPIKEPGRIELPADAVNHLIAFARKRRRAEFGKQTAELLADLASGGYPRIVWIKTARHLLQILETHIDPPLPSDIYRSMEDEIDRLVWGVPDIADISGGLTRLFERLLQDDEAVQGTDWLTDVESYLRNHYTSNPTLTELADKFELNPSYLSYVFKSKRGKSPTDYMIELRIEEAKRLISEFPRLLFKDIAEQVGCSDPYYFSKQFKQGTGQTPTEYKRALTNPS